MTRKEQMNAEMGRWIPILRDRFNAKLIVLFGSGATGRVAEWSDLDLVVVLETPLRFLDRTRELLAALRPSVGLDLLVYTPREWQEMTRTNRFVKEQIVDKGTVIYAA